MALCLHKMSSHYTVRLLHKEDIPAIFQFCSQNPQYFEAMGRPLTIEGIAQDMQALPPGIPRQNKYYVGYYEGGVLVALLDLIDGYPNIGTAFIGLFMVNSAYQGTGIGSKIVCELHEYCASAGFSVCRLGYVQGNAQAEAFWHKAGYLPTGDTAKQDTCTIVIAQKPL